MYNIEYNDNNLIFLFDIKNLQLNASLLQVHSIEYFNNISIEYFKI